jgi:branched-chain amino acid transport system permease protein
MSADTRRVRPDESVLELLDPRPLATRHRVGVLAVVVLALAPLYTDLFTLVQLTSALYLGMFAMSWDVVSGYTGEISFGHAFFFALGGYTSVVLNTTLGLHPLVTIGLGVVVAAIGGLLIGVPALRVSGPYLSLITLIAPLLLLQLFILFSDTFGGGRGVSGETAIVGTQESAVVTVTGGIGAFDQLGVVRVLNFYVAFALFVLVLGGLLVVTRSNVGAVLYAIRSGEDVVAATGKNPAKFKIFVFVLSAAVGGLAGGFLAHSRVGGATPGDLLALELSLLVIIASVVGGMGTIAGAALGGVLLHMVEESVLNSYDGIVVFGNSVADMSFMLLGVFALVVIYALPGGILRWGIERGATLREQVGTLRGDG